MKKMGQFCTKILKPNVRHRLLPREFGLASRLGLDVSRAARSYRMSEGDIEHACPQRRGADTCTRFRFVRSGAPKIYTHRCGKSVDDETLLLLLRD